MEIKLCWVCVHKTWPYSSNWDHKLLKCCGCRKNIFCWWGILSNNKCCSICGMFWQSISKSLNRECLWTADFALFTASCTISHRCMLWICTVVCSKIGDILQRGTQAKVIGISEKTGLIAQTHFASRNLTCLLYK